MSLKIADTLSARSDRTRVETVLEWIDRAAAPLGVEAVSGSDALGRILAESVAGRGHPALRSRGRRRRRRAGCGNRRREPVQSP